MSMYVIHREYVRVKHSHEMRPCCSDLKIVIKKHFLMNLNRILNIMNWSMKILKKAVGGFVL